MDNLETVYRALLQAEPASDELARLEAFKLRYQIYCLERGYEDPARFPDGREQDHFDGRARHVLVSARHDRRPLGTSRLVLDDGSPGSLPIEQHGSVSIARQLARAREHGGAQLAEVSRLAVTRELPSATQELGLVDENIERLQLRQAHVTMGLVALLFHQSWKADVTHWVALMAPALLRVMARIGLHLYPIGAVVEHRGLRQPVMARVDDLWAGVNRQSAHLAQLVHALGVPAEPNWMRTEVAYAKSP